MNLEAETSFVPCEITWASNVDGELFEEILEEDDFMSGQAETSVIKSDLSAGIHIITCTADNGTAIATSDRVLIRIGAGGGNDPETTTTTSEPETTTTTSDSETTSTTSAPDDDNILKGWRMEAQLVVHFVCKLPPIDETATIALSGYENGDVVGENGFFVYSSDADFCNGGNWHRDGQWDINPFGRMVVHEGEQWLELNENTYHIDNIVIECPPGTTQPPIQEDGTWNEGLFMQLVDGANNTVMNEEGDEISWTLQGVAVQEMIP